MYQVGLLGAEETTSLFVLPVAIATHASSSVAFGLPAPRSVRLAERTSAIDNEDGHGGTVSNLTFRKDCSVFHCSGMLDLLTPQFIDH